MEHGCEHTEGSPIGKCAICERTVCSDCYRDIFSAMICDMHEELEDESEWELVGYYSSSAVLEPRRYTLEEHGVTSLVVEGDEDTVELYVPVGEKEDAYAALIAAAEEENYCADCSVQYSADITACPVCGVKAVREEAEDSND